MNVFSAWIGPVCLSLSAAAFADEAAPSVAAEPTQTQPSERAPELAAPLAKEQQESLAKALLSKGICNVAFFGEEFCAQQKTKTFKVTDQFGNQGVEQNVSADENANP